MAHTLNAQITRPAIAAPLNRRDWLLLCVLILGTIAIYLVTATFDFVGYDDQRYIVSDWHIRQGLTLDTVRWAFTDTRSGNWYPLTLLVHLTLATLVGVKPWAFHSLNFSLHAGSVVMLFLFLRRTTGRPWLSAIAVALWAWHPLRVESVAWSAETKDVLCGFLSSACMLAYARYRQQPDVKRYLPVALLLALALLAKPMAVTLPAVLLLLDFWPLGGSHADRLHQRADLRWWRGAALEKIPLLLLSAGAAAVAVFTQNQSNATGKLSTFPLDLRCKNALVAYCTYLGKTFWPTNLGVFYPHPAMINANVSAARWIAAAGLLLLLTLFVLWQARRRPYLPLGWFWFLGTLLPVIGLLQVGEQAMADRYTYFPLIGITAAIVWFAGDLVDHRPRLRAAATMVAAGSCLALAVGAFMQCRHWRNNQILFIRADAAIPNNYLARGILSGYARAAGRKDDALQLARSAVALSPRSLAAQHYYGLALQVVGRPKEALQHFKTAATLNPFDPQVRNDMGGLLVEQGRNADAIVQFREAVRWDPYFTSARHNLAVLLAAEEKYDEAIEQWRTAVRLEPGNGIVHGWLAEALRIRGDRRGAIHHYRAAFAAGERNPAWETAFAWFVAIDPASTAQEVHDVLPAARDAAANARKDHALSLDALAAVQARGGQFNDAIVTAQQAIDRARADGQADLAKAIEARIMKYRAGQPHLSEL